MRLYFAYGSNMVAAQMAKRCPGARLLGPAVLPDHRLAVIRGGHGTVLRQRGACVHGVLWRLGRGNAAALDRYEEIARGLYRRERRRVLAAGRWRAALLYVASSRVPGRPRPRYIGAMIAAASRHGFPEDYLRSLAALRARGSAALALQQGKEAAIAGSARDAIDMLVERLR